ncbi:MAG: YbhB/YbcL family Raf kinase inhibitor-like protein [Bacteroidota bacterium]
MRLPAIIIFATLILIAGCTGSSTKNADSKKSDAKDSVKNDAQTEMTLSSTAFENGKPIPKKYSCDGKNISPALAWSNIPAQTQCLALVCDVPDEPGGRGVHWVVFNISSSLKGLPENFPSDQKNKNGVQQGLNDFKKIGYGGPCPPSGTHHYSFRLYALDCALNSEKPLKKNELELLMKNRILAMAELTGLYSK